MSAPLMFDSQYAFRSLVILANRLEPNLDFFADRRTHSHFFRWQRNRRIVFWIGVFLVNLNLENV